jgi:ElaB/YqjD/DUF883 family membrane-anchored ribosome-binding protein
MPGNGWAQVALENHNLAHNFYGICPPQDHKGIPIMANDNTGSKPSKARVAKPAVAATLGAAGTVPASEARGHFNAALEEAKAGAAALKGDAKDRAATYAGDARTRGEDLASEARAKAAVLAAEGKNKASEALVGLSRVVNDNVTVIDDKLGQKYGDYARSASRSLQETANTLQSKSVDDLGQDAREYVRQNPGKSVGFAIVAGYLLSRLLRR